MDLQLPSEIENTLRRQAAAAGMDAKQFAIVALQQGLAEAASSEVMLPRDKWKKKFDALVASFPARASDTRVDCSRDSIYGDRGR